MDNISMNGVGAASPVTMHGKVVAGFTYTIGMAVTLTGANEVGPGETAGSFVFGIVTKVELEAKDNAGVVTEIILGVQTSGFSDKAIMTATAANRPAVGTIACCNDKGEVIKTPVTAPTVSRGIVTAIDIPNNTATIVI